MTTEETEHEPITVRMADGSVYTLDGERRLRAFHQKYGDEDGDTVLATFRASVASHWANRTKPWKGITLGWGEGPYDDPDESFEDHAALAEPVMYAAIRAPLMAIAMAELSEGDDDSPSVVGIHEDGVVEYTGAGAIEHESIEDVGAEVGEE